MTVTLKNESLTVLIEDKGAQLCSVKNAAGAEYIWKADPAVWNRHAPLLFPLIGRLQDGEYTVHGQTYHIGSHGFARDSLFTVADTAAAGTPLGWAMVGSLALIAAAYMLIHLLIAAWIFAHKEF